MKKRKLGQLEVSEIGMGCMGFSHGYGQVPCENESIDAVQPFRHNIVPATKLHISSEEYRAYGKLSKLIHDHLSASLKNLRTTYVDLYYLHRYNEDIDIEDVANVMKELLDEGLIRGGGLSLVGVDLLQRAHETTPISAVQNLYNMMERDCDQAVIPYCLNHNITVVPFSPIASGLLSGKIDSTTKFEGDDVRKFVPQFQKGNLTANQPIVDLVTSFAKTKNATNTQSAIAWMLKKYPNIVPIPGSKNKTRILENLGAAKVILSDSEFNQLETALAKLEVYGHRGIEENLQHTFSQK